MLGSKVLFWAAQAATQPKSTSAGRHARLNIPPISAREGVNPDSIGQGPQTHRRAAQIQREWCEGPGVGGANQGPVHIDAAQITANTGSACLELHQSAFASLKVQAWKLYCCTNTRTSGRAASMEVYELHTSQGRWQFTGFLQRGKKCSP